MTIRDLDFTPKSWQDIKEPFVIFYASRGKDGIMWCPDCRAVEGLVKDTFEAKDSPAAVIIYVGQRDEWKTPKNQWRGRPWGIQSVPTIVRTRDDERLVESEIEEEKLQSFIESE